jgi:hypothetical protein
MCYVCEEKMFRCCFQLAWQSVVGVNTSTSLLVLVLPTCTVRSESCCALTEGGGSDVHERLYRPEPELN